MKRFIFIVFFPVIICSIIASPSFADAGTGSEGGFYADSSLYLQVVGQRTVDFNHFKDGPVMGIELDHKAACQSFVDCGCFGCQSSSDGLGTAFAPMAEAFIPANNVLVTRILIAEEISVHSADLYLDLHTALPLRPPQG